MFIWGHLDRETTLGTGTFDCPSCKGRRSYSYVVLAKWFHMYFIPLSQGETIAKSPMFTLRNLLWFVAAGVFTSISTSLPTAPTVAEQVESAAEGPSVLAGRIFISAELRTRARANENVEDFRGDVRGVFAIDPLTGRWERIVDDAVHVRVSPDGNFLAFVKVFRRAAKSKADSIAGSGEIWTYDLRSHTGARILDHAGWKCWSPDGRQVVSTKAHWADESTYTTVTWRINRDGTGRTKLPVPDTDTVADWSGDGKWFVTVRRPATGRGLRLYRMHPDGTQESCLTKDGHNCYPRFSPDSRQIVYHRIQEGVESLHTMNVDGTNDHEILREEGLTGVEGSCFSPDGRHLAVVRSNQQIKEGRKVYRTGEGSFHLEVMDADGKRRRKLSLHEAGILWLGHPDWR
jgi:Tol biopolymer transport system component